MSTETNKEIIRKVNECFTNNDMATFIDKYCTDDVKWSMVGQPAMEGKDAIRQDMMNATDTTPPVFTVTNMIAEGNIVMCEGEITMKKRDGSPYHGAYCDVYRMRDGKIEELHSYMVEYKQEA